MSLLYIILFIALLHSVPTFANIEEKCYVPSNIISIIQNRYNLTLYGTNISIAYNSSNIATKLLPNNILEILLNTASVSFESVSSYKGSPKHEIVVHYNIEPIIIHHKKQGYKYICRTDSAINFGITLNLNNDNEEAVVIQLTEYCIKKLLCDNLNSIIRNNWLQKHLQQQPPSQNLIYNNSCSELLNHIYNPQNTINAMMDFGASILISKLDVNKNGVFDIPEINADFAVGKSFWRVTGDVIASNGKFCDLRKVKRDSDMIFTHDGLRFSVGSTYSLSEAKLTFSSYKVRFGIINISGEISVNIGKITVEAKASFDYNDKPCQATLDKLNINGLDQLDIHMTGLGPLNGAAIDVIKRKIQSNALDSLKQAVVQKLNELECEKFRPT